MNDTTLAPPRTTDQETIDALRTELTQAKYRHHADIEAISEHLIALADEHGWCDTYDNEIDGLNRRLNVPLLTRVKTWEVTYRVTVRFDDVKESDLEALCEHAENALYDHDTVTDVTQVDIEEA